MKHLEWFIEKLVALIEIFSMGMIFLCVIMQVTFRFIFHSPLPWPEELSRILFICLVFVGAAEASRENSHIAIDLKDVFHLSDKTDKFLNVFRLALVAFVLAVVAHGAYAIIPTGYNMHLPATGLPMSVMTVPVLVGSVLMLAWSLIHLIRDGVDLVTGNASRPTVRS